MNVDKIARIFSAQNGPAQLNNNNVSQAQEAAPLAAAQNNDAVQVADSVTDTSRSEKLARIQEAVRNNTYKPDNNLVAAAVYKELIA